MKKKLLKVIKLNINLKVILHGGLKNYTLNLQSFVETLKTIYIDYLLRIKEKVISVNMKN